MQNSPASNSNVDSAGRYNLFVILAIIEGFFIGINFIGMLFRALQIKSKLLCMQIIPSLFIMIQVPLFPLLLGFVFYSVGFLFVYRKNDPKTSSKSIRNLIRINVAYVLYFAVMFVYWGITMNIPRSK